MNAKQCGCYTDPGQQIAGLDEHIVYCPLHAAAPELLECLTDLLGKLHASGLDRLPGDDGMDVQDACEDARKAIAKAEGR